MRRLLLTNFGIHAADQLALAALPLIATLLMPGGPALAGMLVAAQGAAWLLLSLPAGAWVDRFPRRRLMVAASAIAALALVPASLSVAAAPVLAMLVMLAAAGTVVTVLASFAILPELVGRDGLPLANARLELARAAATLLAAPLAGTLAALGRPEGALLLAAGLAALAALGAGGLPTPGVPPSAEPRPMLHLLSAGARFVWDQPLLRAVATAAVAWNFAFFALAAVAMPLALEVLQLSPRLAGLAIGGYGAGLMAGALLAGRLAPRQAPGRMLLAGPALSVLAMLAWGAALRAGTPGARLGLVAMAQFLLGFGPMLWQVVQTSLRQVVTPPALLGRVGATMQVAVFGVRPLGALAGGALAAQMGFGATLWLVALGFTLSLVVVAASPLRRLRAMPAPA
ncbi:MFS transporter [Roseomonas sp. M0104]|uniref:MFS transporter n=1 Tax=Teichococcus coralli TaxID=2545983 RepID=A0A845B8X4_9PROT|nr:MFS transporter [Pseudoroseomonas coralli]MXP61817.1 MFS transporter [Pseudoroseomonas coralli]